MRSWMETGRLAVVLLAVAFSGSPAISRAQDRTLREAAPSVAEVERILQDGVVLEEQRRWGDALSHYEDALRKHPGQRALADRLSVARFHYELSRRYSDSHYIASIKGMAERDALELYNDVLLKIHAHYVDRPDWQSLLQRGHVALEIALAEPTFRQEYGVAATDEQLRTHWDELRHALSSQPVRTRQESKDAVSFVARSTADRFGVPPAAVVLEYACACGASLDDYSAFLTGNQLDEIMSQIEGNFVGLGIELKSETDALLIVNVIPGGPAERAGLVSGDRILAVNGKTMRDVSTDAAADMLKGEEGTSVDLVLANPQGLQRTQRVLRQVVEVPSVDKLRIEDQKFGIAYLRLASFQKTTSRDVEAALWQLHREGMRSLILDLRGNPGGLLTASVEVADKFITEGTIVSTRGRGTGEDFDYKAHLVGTWRVPLIVLIDGNSASASEIFAAAIRDAERGTLVGQRSFGKGSVQGIFPLAVGHAGLRLTTAKFYSPHGNAISGQGVQPHVAVPVNTSVTVAKPVVENGASLPASTDEVLEAALQLARRQLAQR